MKIKRFFKIVLLICCLLLTLISIVLMYTVVIVQNSTFEYSMLIPLLMIPTGVLSVIYHFKTLKYYSLNFDASDLKDFFLWVGNFLFALSTLSMIFFMMYSIYNLEKVEMNSGLYYGIIFCGFIFLICIFLIIEESWLYKRVLNSKEQSRIANIDDIRGWHDDKIDI